MTTLRPAHVRDRVLDKLRDRVQGSLRILVKELSAFGVIGALAFVIDLTLFTWLAAWWHAALKAKIVSTVLSTTFAYFGNRYLSFSHRARTGLARETAYFFAINGLTLAFSLLVLALFVYPLGFGHAGGVIFAVNIVTIGLGTVFRFWAYKRFVFLHPDKVHADNPNLEKELAE